MNDFLHAVRCDRPRKPYCSMPHLVRRWEQEAEFARQASIHNQMLVATARTEFRIGDEAWLEGRERVVIVEVQPAGFISKPRKYGNDGRLLGAVTADVDLYVYQRPGQPGGAKGQTTGERLGRRPGPLAPGRLSAQERLRQALGTMPGFREE